MVARDVPAATCKRVRSDCSREPFVRHAVQANPGAVAIFRLRDTNHQALETAPMRDTRVQITPTTVLISLDIGPPPFDC